MNTFFSNKNVLVTGGAGFLGSNLCERLLKEGAKVWAADNLLTGQEKNLAACKQNGGENFTFLKADVNQAPEEYLPNGVTFDLIFHFASPASPPRYQKYPIETYLVNSLGTHQLLQYLTEKNPQGRFVFASTSEIYGDPLVHPQVETYWGNVNPNGIRSCYDEAKRLGETICGVHHREFQMDVRMVRIFNTYGINMDPEDGRVVPDFIKQSLKNEPLQIHGDGMQTRSYCFADDLIEGILRLASFDNLAGETINIGNDNEYTVLQTAQIIYKTVTGKELDLKNNVNFKPLPNDDPLKRRPDISKAKQLLNWTPEISFEAGLQKTLEYFRSL
jgi:nucleoside-diphosphate-sugar epimerase